MVNKDVKMRESTRSSHDFHIFNEEIDHFRAKKVYKRYRRAYEKDQRWQCQKSKQHQPKHHEHRDERPSRRDKEQNLSISFKSKSRNEPQEKSR